MNILVLGGTHFIGAHAVRRLASLGHEVTVFHRGKTQADMPKGVKHLYGDRKQLRDHKETFLELKPNVVLDTLAMTEQDAKDVVRVFAGLTERLMVLSSCDVYRAYDRLRGADPGPIDPVPLGEAAPLRDKLYPYREEAGNVEDRMYNYDKILVERAVTAQPETFPATVLRLPMVYGPGDYQHRLHRYLKRMDDGRPAILLPLGMGDWRGCRGYVEDIADAIALCVTKDEAANQIFNVAEAAVTEREWLARLAAEVGWTGEILELPAKDLSGYDQVLEKYDWRQDWTLDSSAIRERLGYQERFTPEEAMQRTVVWERANPPEIKAEQFDYAAEDEALAAHHDSPNR